MFKYQSIVIIIKIILFIQIIAETPIFSILPDKLYELNIGTNLELQCDAEPKSVITWFNKSLNRNLTTGNRILFENITSSIDGAYECIASNQVIFTANRS